MPTNPSVLAEVIIGIAAILCIRERGRKAFTLITVGYTLIKNLGQII